MTTEDEVWSHLENARVWIAAVGTVGVGIFIGLWNSGRHHGRLEKMEDRLESIEEALRDHVTRDEYDERHRLIEDRYDRIVKECIDSRRRDK